MTDLAVDTQHEEVLPRSNRSNSPFRYPGGKFYARRLILDEIPDHSIYAEPFCGGASVFFAKEPARVSILNDLDEDVINTLRHIRDRVEDLIKLLDGIPATKRQHHRFKNRYEPTCGLTRALRWFFLNRTSYSGIMREENCYWGYGRKYSMRPENWPPHLRTVSDRLQGAELTVLDFEVVIDSLPDGCFAFLDPPYYDADQQKFYNCTFDKGDHDRLAECLKRNSERILFLLTYDDHPHIRERYEWVSEVHNRTWNYTINRTDDQKNGLKLKDGFRGGGAARVESCSSEIIMSEQDDALRVYRSIQEYCETYNIPEENLMDILEDQKVLPMIRGKATEYIGTVVLRKALDPRDWSVDKLNLNPQPGAIDEDISITHRMTGKRLKAETKNAVRGKFSTGTRMTPEPHFAVKCHKSRSSIKKAKTTNDRYLLGDFDVLLCNVSNSIFQGNARDRGLPLIPDQNAVGWLKRHYGVDTDAELRRCTYDDWRVCLPANIADEDGVIPRTPRILMVRDPNWFGLNDLSVNLRTLINGAKP